MLPGALKEKEDAMHEEDDIKDVVFNAMPIAWRNEFELTSDHEEATLKSIVNCMDKQDKTSERNTNSNDSQSDNKENNSNQTCSSGNNSRSNCSSNNNRNRKPNQNQNQ